MKYLMMILVAGCSIGTAKNPNRNIHECMVDLIERGVHAQIAQDVCKKTFDRGDSHLETK